MSLRMNGAARRRPASRRDGGAPKSGAPKSGAPIPQRSAGVLAGWPAGVPPAILAILFAFAAFAQTSLKVPDAAQLVGPPKGAPVAGAQLNQRTHEVAGLLRCPVCQGMSVAESTAEMAINMKGQVRELLARGYTEEQILKYFELSYGQFVLLRPKSPVVWLLPVLALVLGVLIVVLKIRKLSGAAVSQPADAPVEDPYLDRVRDLVSGGKS